LPEILGCRLGVKKLILFFSLQIFRRPHLRMNTITGLTLVDLPSDVYFEIFQWCDEIDVWRMSFTGSTARGVAWKIARQHFVRAPANYPEFVQRWAEGRYFSIAAALHRGKLCDRGWAIGLAGYIGGERGDALMKRVGFGQWLGSQALYAMGQAHRGSLARPDEWIDMYPYAILAGLAAGHRIGEFRSYIARMRAQDPSPRFRNQELMSSRSSPLTREYNPFCYKFVMQIALASRNWSAVRQICGDSTVIRITGRRTAIAAHNDNERIGAGSYCEFLVEFCELIGSEWSHEIGQTFYAFCDYNLGAHLLSHTHTLSRDHIWYLVIRVAIKNDNRELFYLASKMRYAWPEAKYLLGSLSWDQLMAFQDKHCQYFMYRAACDWSTMIISKFMWFPPKG
jgi:hypothetical protein